MDESLVSRYWCHMCSQMVSPVMDADMKCPYCEEGFLEEMNSREDLDAGDLGSDRALSLWAPILLGMIGDTTRRRRYYRREEFDDEFDQDREIENSLHRRRRRSSAAILQLLQGLRAELSSESENSEGTRLGERERDQEGLLLINPFNQALVLNNQNQNQNSDAPPAGSSLGDYFVGPGLEMLLQHLAENDPNRYGTPPAQKEAIEAMPTVKIDRSLSCPVCLDDFEAGAEAKEMPCNHKFHPGCILPWLELHSSCPVCRFQMPADGSKTSNATNNRSERASGGSNEDGGNGNNRLWIPFQWPFSGLFSSSGSQRNGGGGNSGSSSSSSPFSGDNQNHTYEN